VGRDAHAVQARGASLHGWEHMACGQSMQAMWRRFVLEVETELGLVWASMHT